MTSEELTERREKPTQDPKRNPYMRDKARILHSAFFRRLQSKKQIHDVDVSDFGRTRLTHTLEVAQIATGIREVLSQKNDAEITKLLPDIFCIEAAALAHDLGHPPNGHGGERALNYLMLNHGGFEGNAQTFRIVAKLGEYEKGLNLTRATMLGMLKYPVLYNDVVNTNIYPTQERFPQFYKFAPPKCIFKSEEKTLDWLLAPFNKKDQKKYLQIEFQEQKHSKAKYLNFFASIVDLADDIAYGVHDLEDAIALRLISIKDYEEQKENFKTLEENCQSTTQDLFSSCSKKRKSMISKIVHLFTNNVKVEVKGIFESLVLDCKVTLPTDLKKLLANLKKFIEEKVILRRENQLMEFKLQNITVELFYCLCSNVENFLPEKYYKRIKEKEDSKERVVCDYIAGMTDRYLIKLYRTLFSPDCGSIFDKI